MNNMNHIHLFGDPLENFYILGKKDKDSYQNIYNQISSLCIRNKHLTKILRIANELSQHLDRKKTQQQFHKELAAYAEGLEVPYQEILYSFLLPEIVSSFNKWVPDLMSLIPGCSSLFVPGNKGGVIHTRILDYALNESFTKSERSILYDFDDRYKSISFSCAGVPFPALSAMNDQGLTLALHYKHGQHFNNHGESIFFIASEIINTCSNIREAIKLIKKKSSISYWGLYLSDNQGEVASIDIRGKDIFQEKFDIKDHNFLYFNNRPLLKHENQNHIQPYGHTLFCKEKADYIKEQIKISNKNLSENPMQTSLEILGSINRKETKTFKQTAITAASIQLIAFDAYNELACFQPGMAPKILNKQLIQYKELFSGDLKTLTNDSPVNDDNLTKGFRCWGFYQSNIDKGDINKAYHAFKCPLNFLKEDPKNLFLAFILI